MGDLFADSDNSSEELALKTENQYAKKYDAWREKEEKYKLEQKYGENPSEADLESSDSEDDDEPPEVSEKLEKDFLKTLSLLKTQDPRIYDTKFNFFEEEVQKDKKKETVEVSVSTSEQPKKAVKSLADAFDASDGEEDGLIFKVEKPRGQPEKKEDKLKEFLTGKLEHMGDETEEDLKALKALWSDPKLNEGEAFLRDYILNKKYLEEDEQGTSGKLLDDADLEADEAIVEEQGKFERAYNYRFEEPDQEFLKRYPRTIAGTRPKDDRRARKRAEIRERKEAEKRKKMEEIGRLKALKLKEIQEKIEQIKHVTGNKELAFEERDIEGDFDPTEHDRRMAAIFDEQYYGDCDERKPVFPDLDEELEIENWDKYEEEMGIDRPGPSTDGPHCEDQDFNMDAEYDPKKSRATLLEEIQQTLGKKRRNRKRKNKLAEILVKEKPKYDPRTMQKTYDEYMEEYYKMDCEDVIGGDLPTRFKYRDVVPNSYGLTVEEILLADDKDLNKWVSLKKTVKYRPEHVEKSEVKTYQMKAADVSLKKKLLPSLFKEMEEPEAEPIPKTATKKKKKRKKNKNKNAESTKKETDQVSATTDYAVSFIDELENTKKGIKKEQTEVQNVVKNQDVINNKIKSEVNGKDYVSKKTRKGDKNTTVDRSNDYSENNDSSLNESTMKVLKIKKKNKRKGPPIELPTTEERLENMSREVNNIGNDSTQGKNKKKKSKMEQTGESLQSKDVANDKNRKRKLPFNTDGCGKKIKLNQNKYKNNKKNDPAVGLSDERLKAYGLNPKKYRNFLKHKKY